MSPAFGGDTLASYGGDEFIAVMRDLDKVEDSAADF